MADLKPLPVISLPGIKRDGTRLQGENYVDGLWMRFERGLPRKIKGYERLTNLLPLSRAKLADLAEVSDEDWLCSFSDPPDAWRY